MRARSPAASFKQWARRDPSKLATLLNTTEAAPRHCLPRFPFLRERVRLRESCSAPALSEEGMVLLRRSGSPYACTLSEVRQPASCDEFRHTVCASVTFVFACRYVTAWTHMCPDETPCPRRFGAVIPSDGHVRRSLPSHGGPVCRMRTCEQEGRPGTERVVSGNHNLDTLFLSGAEQNSRTNGLSSLFFKLFQRSRCFVPRSSHGTFAMHRRTQCSMHMP